jgi:hypothetical protein
MEEIRGLLALSAIPIIIGLQNIKNEIFPSFPDLSSCRSIHPWLINLVKGQADDGQYGQAEHRWFH